MPTPMPSEKYVHIIPGVFNVIPCCVLRSPGREVAKSTNAQQKYPDCCRDRACKNIAGQRNISYVEASAAVRARCSIFSFSS
jgi:hypothetical protein